MKINNQKKAMAMFLFFLITFLPQTTYASTTNQSGLFGYEKQDKAGEQQKFLARLKEDKKKVDFAIKNTKILIDKARTRPYLPEIYLRLAELYIEKSRIVYFLRKSEIPDSVKLFENLETNSLKNRAIEIYQRILNDFPEFEDRDKVLFFLAHEFRELGQIQEMIKQYRALIKNYKNSQYAPEAYLLLGDYFFNNGDLDMAQTHYEAVFNYPDSGALAVARYKLGWCHINRGGCKKAITLFEESVNTILPSDEIDIDTYKKVDIRLESLVDMAFCYSEVYKESTPQDAIDYFKKFAWSRPVYVMVLEKMANRFMIKKKWLHGATLYRELATMQQDAEKLLEYAKNIFEAVQVLNSFDGADKDMAIIMKALKKQKYSIHITAEEKSKNLHEYELYARDIVTHLHRQAAKETVSDEATIAKFKKAADAYRLYLDFLEDTPVYNEMVLNYAETLFSSKQYLEAGKQYERIAKNITEPSKQREKMLYSSVLSYYSALKDKVDLNYYETSYARGGLKTAGNIFTGEFPGSVHVANVLFNIAWVTYDEGNDEEAIKQFASFVDRYPDGKEARSAIHLILDTHHKNEEYDRLIDFGNGIIENAKITNRKFKKEVAVIVNAANSKVLSSLSLEALGDWDKGRESINEFVAKNKSSTFGEQALSVLVATSIAQGDLKTLFSSGSQLIEQHPASSSAEEALGVMIDNTLKAAQFRLVAKYLEKFAEIRPDHENRGDFLYQASQIRQNLGQLELANKDYQLAINSLPKGVSKEDIVFSMAENAYLLNKADSAIKILKNRKKVFSVKGKIKVNALLSYYYFKKGRVKDTFKYLNMAKKAYAKNGENDVELNDLIARMDFNSIGWMNDSFMKIKLKNKIDNKLVVKKTKLLGELEKAYVAVIKRKSHKWALSSIYQSYKINMEYGQFLKESPMPVLSPDQKKQYSEIIAKKAKTYITKADTYLQTFINQAHKWEIIDTELSKNLYNSDNRSSKFPGLFSKQGGNIEITDSFIDDSELKSLHKGLIENPDNVDSLLALAKAYSGKSDYRQAILIGQKALDLNGEGKSIINADIYNTLGVSYLHTGDDELAKASFKKALTIDGNHTGATVNLAGLYRHYGHNDKADNLFNSLNISATINNTAGSIHQKAKYLYDEYMKGRVQQHAAR